MYVTSVGLKYAHIRHSVICGSHGPGGTPILYTSGTTIIVVMSGVFIGEI